MNAFKRPVREDLVKTFIAKIQEIDKKVLVLDLEGVVGPKLSTLPPGMEISRKLREYVTGRIGIGINNSEELDLEFSRLSEKYNTDALLYALHREYGLSYQEIIKEVYMPELNKLEQYLTPDRELRELLRKTRNLGKRIVLLSNSNSAVADAMLNGLQLSSMFDEVITVERFNSVLRPKPHPGAYGLALVHTGNIRRNEEAIYVDDKKENLVAPHNMGITTVLVSGEEVRDDTSYRVNDLASLLRVVNTVGFLH